MVVSGYETEEATMPIETSAWNSFLYVLFVKASHKASPDARGETEGSAYWWEK